MIMVIMMYKNWHAMELKYQLITAKLKCMGFIFVDDTDSIVIAKEEENIEVLNYRQQQDTLC